MGYLIAAAEEWLGRKEHSVVSQRGEIVAKIGKVLRDAKESLCFLSELESVGLMIVSDFSTSGRGGGDGAALQNCHVCSCAVWCDCSTCGTLVKAMSLISFWTCPL